MREEELMCENKLVTVIVPVYNVKDYLRDCLNSLVNQTYKNIEVIMVDDGSTDGSDIIAKSYLWDKRFTYIYQENAGLSAARNTGLDYAKGDYITFLDSDDYLSEEFIDILLTNAIKCDSAVTACGYYRVEDDNSIEKIFSTNMLLSSHDAMKILGNIFDDDANLLVISCAKLYKKEIFNGLRYPIGKTHEDEFMVHRIVDKADKICLLDKAYYYYIQRSDSITGTDYSQKKNHLDLIDAAVDRIKILSLEKYSDIYGLFVYSAFEIASQLCLKYSENNIKSYKLGRLLRQKLFLYYLMGIRYFSKENRFDYLQMMICPVAYKRRIEKIIEKKR